MLWVAATNCWKALSSDYLSHQLNALQLNFECLWNGSHVLWLKSVNEACEQVQFLCCFWKEAKTIGSRLWFKFFFLNGDGVHCNGENYSTAVIQIEKDQVLHPEEFYFYKMEHLWQALQQECQYQVHYSLVIKPQMGCGRRRFMCYIHVRKMHFSYRYPACQQGDVTSH